MDIKLISTQDLLKDKTESMVDIENCNLALLLNITTYSGGSVKERLETNQKIVDKIDKELERRTPERMR